MAMDTAKKAVTIKEFEEIQALPENRDRLLELIDGEIVEKVVTHEHGIIAGLIVTEINLYLRQHKIGRAAVEARHRPAQDDQNDRLPDVSFVGDLDKAVVRAGAVPYMPDLAVEIKSPDDSLKEIRAKARFYLANGTRIVWVVLPERKTVEVYTPQEELIVSGDETLSGGDVLPGFSMTVSAVFEY